MSATRDVGEAIQGIQLGARQNMENVDKAVEIINQARLWPMSPEAR